MMYVCVLFLLLGDALSQYQVSRMQTPTVTLTTVPTLLPPLRIKPGQRTCRSGVVYGTRNQQGERGYPPPLAALL